MHIEGAVGQLDGLTAFFDYKENTPLAKLIKMFKYNYTRDVEKLWRDILICGVELGSNFGNNKNPAVIGIPLHPRRQRERGFNQSEILARVFLDVLKKDYPQASYVENKLIRSRYTEQQAKLSKDGRRKNVHEAFVWQSPEKPPNKVILVDDVFTTGATMEECARVLKQNGAKYVYGLTLGRAVSF